MFAAFAGLGILAGLTACPNPDLPPEIRGYFLGRELVSSVGANPALGVTFEAVGDIGDFDPALAATQVRVTASNSVEIPIVTSVRGSGPGGDPWVVDVHPAEGRPDLTPFTAFSWQALRDDGVDLIVTNYKRENPNLDMGKSAVVFTVTTGGTGPWEVDEVRLMAEPYMQARPFAMRASARVIAPGNNARIAVVIPTDALKSGPDGDRLVLELWRAGVGRQAKVELVAVDDSLIPSIEQRGRPR